MTYEEAFDVLVFKIHIIDAEHTETFERDVECLKKCAEALKKQIPKKPKVKTTFNSGFQTHECPNCGNEFGFCRGIKYSKYCPKCGQRLDWGDEE